MSELFAEAALDSPRGLGGEGIGDQDIFAHEAAQGHVAMPSTTIDYRDVLKVIDARERSLQNIKTFLASMVFIRGNARSLPPGVLRRGRSKLARLLARHRVHSAVVVELIVKWRQRHGLALGLGAPPLGAPLPPPPGPSADDRSNNRSPDSNANSSPAPNTPLPMDDQVKYYLPQNLAGTSVSTTMASAMAVASKKCGPPAPRHRIKAEGEPGERKIEQES